MQRLEVPRQTLILNHHRRVNEGTSTGKPLYEQERLGAEGEYYASPIAAIGHVYLASSRGTITTIRAGDALQVEARNDLGESVMTTPAIADSKLYIRSANHLWAFGRK